ncbi:hypothetical protein HK102_008832, partial [Quaeritorhiza haematococci]
MLDQYTQQQQQQQQQFLLQDEDLPEWERVQFVGRVPRYDSRPIVEGVGGAGGRPFSGGGAS